MSELYWPGEGRAGELFTESAFLAAMVRVESAWIAAPLELPEATRLDTESGGNAVIPLIAALRTAHPDLADRIHVGLTSQDVVDTALVLMLQDTVDAVGADVRRQWAALAVLIGQHDETAMLGRTLTQPARAITVGHKLLTWREGIAEARANLVSLSLPVQCGGPVGLGVEGHEQLAERLGLEDSAPWHTRRGTITRAGDALVSCTDAWGRIARDVLELSRPEIGELSEGAGGGSSSMPHKHNPVLSVLIRRAALSTPMLGATLHLAAAEQVDERADGGWHVEWDTLRLLARRTAVAASQTADLLEQLVVHADRMAANLDQWGPQ